MFRYPRVNLTLSKLIPSIPSIPPIPPEMQSLQVLMLVIFCGLLFMLMVLSAISASNSYDVDGCEKAHTYATYTSVVSGLVVLSAVVFGLVYQRQQIMSLFSS